MKVYKQAIIIYLNIIIILKPIGRRSRDKIFFLINNGPRGQRRQYLKIKKGGWYAVEGILLKYYW